MKNFQFSCFSFIIFQNCILLFWTPFLINVEIHFNLCSIILVILESKDQPSFKDGFDTAIRNSLAYVNTRVLGNTFVKLVIDRILVDPQGIFENGECSAFFLLIRIAISLHVMAISTFFNDISPVNRRKGKISVQINYYNFVKLFHHNYLQFLFNSSNPNLIWNLLISIFH